MLRRWGDFLYTLATRALPGELRRRCGADMRQAFRRGQEEAEGRGGARALLGYWARELGGLALTAWRARRPDAWSRRTAPPADTDIQPYRLTMDNFRSDLRHALRAFARRPGMVILAVLTLSLGIGASTSMFSVIESVLLEPLPYPEPEELYSVYPAWPQLRDHPTMANIADRGTWSWPEYWTVAESQDVFRQLAAWERGFRTLSGEGRPERVSVVNATWQIFPMLGATPHLGRLFDADDTSEDRVAVLTADYWRDRFGGDPDIVGQTLRLDDEAYTVVGVLNPGFELQGASGGIWLPRTGSPTDNGMGNHGGTRAMGRIADGVSQERARQQIARILREDLPATHGEHDASVFPRQADETRGARPVLLILMAAAGLLLVVACGNVAALLLGAGIDREQELAVRGAIGASRKRIAQHLLSESAVLSLLGAAGGVAVAWLAIQGLVYLAPPGVPRIEQAALNPSAVLFAVAVSVVCGVAFGSVPALSLSGQDLSAAMGAGRGTSSQRTRILSLVVVGELALATALVVGGALLGRTVLALNGVDPGFQEEGLIALAVAAPNQRFVDAEGERDQEAQYSYFGQITEALEGAPGVEGVVQSSVPPFFGYRGNNNVLPEGWSDPDNPPTAERRFVTTGYFETLGIPLVEGRGFRPEDEITETEVVVVVSEGLADLAWPGESALGKTLSFWGVDARVVGVAANIKDESLRRPTELAYYAPAMQTGTMSYPFLVRTSGDPASVIPALRDRIWAVDAELPITRVATVSSLMGDQVADQRYRARLMAVFAALAGIFALMGIYGVTARSVARRTREMGIRIALGAGVGSVRKLVTIQAVRLAVYGVLLGLGVAVVAGRVLERFLWGVSGTDPLTLAAVGIILPLAAALAALPPALRATRVDPLEALKAE